MKRCRAAAPAVIAEPSYTVTSPRRDPRDAFGGPLGHRGQMIINNGKRKWGGRQWGHDREAPSAMLEIPSQLQASARHPCPASLSTAWLLFQLMERQAASRR